MSETITPDLVFASPAPASPDLVFGANENGLSAVDLTVTGTLPGLTATVSLIPNTRVELVGQMPGLQMLAFVRPAQPVQLVGAMPSLTFAAGVLYVSQTQRPTVGATVGVHQVATVHQTGTLNVHQDGITEAIGWVSPWLTANGHPHGVEHPLPALLGPSRIGRAVAFQAGQRGQSTPRFRQQDASPIWQERLGAFQATTAHRHGRRFPHQNGTPVKRLLHNLFQNVQQFHAAGHAGAFQSAVHRPEGWQGVYQDGVPPPPGLSIVLQPGPQPVSCYTPDPALLYSWPQGYGGPHLVFVCGHYPGNDPVPEPIIIPVQRVYIVINNIALRRTSDNALVHALSMNLSLDASSWTWGFDAALPATELAMVDPSAGAVELSAWVNGTEFRVLAESVSRERVFGQAGIRVSGRGRNAVLDAPFAPVTNFTNPDARTSQQLMDDALALNGIPLGWSIDWGLEAWTVPAGVWNHQGTYISALATIAQAAGGYLIPHASAQSFKVRHRYPVAPWDWSTVTPDIVLPADVVTRESTAWKEKAAYNRVYVSGQQQGVLGRVTRAGTAGDVLAPMVTDPLITTAAAARQRGLAILGDTGRQIEHGLRLPVLPETGVIEPGTFVEYQDGGASRIGLVRSTRVELGESTAYQTLGVECHA